MVCDLLSYFPLFAFLPPLSFILFILFVTYLPDSSLLMLSMAFLVLSAHVDWSFSSVHCTLPCIAGFYVINLL